MDLTNPTTENTMYMIEQIKEKIRMVNVDAMRAENFDTDKYEDLHYIYEMVMKRKHISSNELEAIAAELGSLRR
ncbi:DUF1128 domain-containing protein [Sporosarcina siberiensis]|uniref:UPF0435 protein ACFSFY_07100 n=1 Tax=Sporosarcina siberiensis TaxID=1365606 RepID=A0ABW4SEJ5_9BACL